MTAAKTSRPPVRVKLGCQDTRRNLPPPKSLQNGEDCFMAAFERAYLARETAPSVVGREFAIEGFGRADLVWLAWEGSTSEDDFKALSLRRRVRLTAIEGKVSDWRKGLQQAFRYRYFAHRSLLVLPKRTAQTAAAFLPTFRRLRVGLWGFDSETGRIKKWFTPRPARPLSRGAWQKAVHLIESCLDLGQAPERL